MNGSLHTNREQQVRIQYTRKHRHHSPPWINYTTAKTAGSSFMTYYCFSGLRKKKKHSSKLNLCDSTSWLWCMTQHIVLNSVVQGCRALQGILGCKCLKHFLFFNWRQKESRLLWTFFFFYEDSDNNSYTTNHYIRLILLLEKS